MRAAGLILAAGRGERAGGPKALWRVASGGSLAALHAGAMRAAGLDPVLVVARADVAARLSLPEGARAVVSDEPEARGPAGSIRAALGALRGSAVEAVVVTPVDKRPAAPAEIAALLAALGPTRVARAGWEGRGGHPVALALGELSVLDGEGAATLRDVVRAAREAGTLAEVSTSPASLDDLDDERSLEAALGGGPA